MSKWLERKLWKRVVAAAVAGSPAAVGPTQGAVGLRQMRTRFRTAVEDAEDEAVVRFAMEAAALVFLEEAIAESSSLPPPMEMLYSFSMLSSGESERKGWCRTWLHLLFILRFLNMTCDVSEQNDKITKV